jgi:hypothetical protein
MMEVSLKEYWGYEKLKYGVNRACCKGHCVTGPGWPKLSIIILNVLLLYANIGWYVYLGPYYFKYINAAPPILAFLCGIWAQYVLMSLWLRDPGFLLRNSNYDELIKDKDKLNAYIES